MQHPQCGLKALAAASILADCKTGKCPPDQFIICVYLVEAACRRREVRAQVCKYCPVQPIVSQPWLYCDRVHLQLAKQQPIHSPILMSTVSLPCMRGEVPGWKSAETRRPCLPSPPPPSTLPLQLSPLSLRLVRPRRLISGTGASSPRLVAGSSAVARTAPMVSGAGGSVHASAAPWWCQRQVPLQQQLPAP